MWLSMCVSLVSIRGVFVHRRLRVCVCVRVHTHWAGLLPLVSPLPPPPPPPSLNTPGSRASTASAAAVLSSSSSSASSSRPRHHKSLSSSNHPCPSDLHAPRPRQVSLASSHHPSSINLKGRGELRLGEVKGQTPHKSVAGAPVSDVFLYDGCVLLSCD